jgi:hypothetical protein
MPFQFKEVFSEAIYTLIIWALTRRPKDWPKIKVTLAEGLVEILLNT